MVERRGSVDSVAFELVKLQTQIERLSNGQERLRCTVDGLRGEVAALPDRVRGTGISPCEVPPALNNSQASRDNIAEGVESNVAPKRSQTDCTLPSRRDSMSGSDLHLNPGVQRLVSVTWGRSARSMDNLVPVASDASEPPRLELNARTWGDARFSSAHDTKPQLRCTFSRDLGTSTIKPFRPFLPFHPTSPVRTLFDVLTLVALVFDSVMLPYVLAWDLPSKGALSMISWGLLAFWAVDIPMSFLTGFVDKDKMLVMDMRGIARHYVRTWFLTDLVVVCVDFGWLMLSEELEREGGSQTLIVRIVRFAKVGRFMRIVAKLRAGLLQRSDKFIMKAAGILGMAHHISFITMFWKLTLLITWMSHLGSCLWFSVCQMTSGSPRSWREMLTDDEDPASSSEFYMYLTGLYWAVSSMFSGASFLPPTNSTEAIFSALYIVLTSLFTTSLTSSLAAMLVRSQMQRQEQGEELRRLYKFLSQHRVEPLLSLAICEQVVERMEAPKRLTEQDVPALGLISTNLRDDLQYNIYAEHFIGHPTFRMFNAVDSTLLRHLCASGVSHVAACPGREVFIVEEHMEQAYIVLRGRLEYRLAGMRSATKVPRGQWICELALWAHWQSVGSLQATDESELLMVSVGAVKKALLHRPQSLRLARGYSAQLCEVMSKGYLKWTVSDLDCGVDSDLVVAGMPRPLRQIISAPVLQMFHSNWLSGLFNTRQKNYAELEQEVKEGKSHLVFDGSGQALRVVRVITLKLARHDGLLCVRIAKWRDGVCTPGVELPGGKIREDEVPEDVVSRISKDLWPAFPSIELLNKEVVIERSRSASYGVNTKYIKLVYTAETHVSCERTMASLDSDLRGVRNPSFGGWKVFSLQSGASRAGTGSEKLIFAWMPPDDFTYLVEEGSDAKGVVNKCLEGLTDHDIEKLRLD